MPVKLRRGKARDLTKSMLSELHYGPGFCLLAGCGYWHGDFYHRLDVQTRSKIYDEMRGDWNRHHARVLAAWEARSGHELYIAEAHHGDPARPWAETEFGKR